MTVICMTTLVVMSGTIFGQSPTVESAPVVPRSGVQIATTEPAFSNTQRVPEDAVDGPRRKVVILPREPGEAGAEGTPIDEGQRTGAVVAKLTPEQHRLPEGYVIGSRVGRVDRDGKWFVVRLQPQEGMPDASALRVLPNRELAKVEAILTDVPNSRDFLLTGRITEFQGVNYLLLEHVAQASGQSVRRSQEKAVVSTQPATDDISSTPGREPTPEEILSQLMKNEPEKALVLPPANVTSRPTAGMGNTKSDRATQDPSGWPEGTFLVDRLGRVVPSGDGWWSLAWEDRGDLGGRKPIRLLQNRLLESAVALSGGGTRGVVFIVSGEVTEYKGMNYLLLRKVLIRRDLGNLR